MGRITTPNPSQPGNKACPISKAAANTAVKLRHHQRTTGRPGNPCQLMMAENIT